MAETDNGLKKTLRPLDAVMIVVGNVVGVGIFTTTGFIAGDIPDARLIMAVWLFGGLLTLFGALSYGELGAAFPRAGGDYVYLREAYGPLAGFLVGWVGFSIINPGSIAALALGFVEYLMPLAVREPGAVSPIAAKAVGVSVILVFTAVNLLSVRWASRAQNLVCGLNLLTMILMLGAGFLWGAGNWDHFQARSDSASIGDLFGPAMISVFFTYSGWFVSAYVASEMKDPRKTLPLSLIAGSILVTILYTAMNLFYIYALPVSDMKGAVDIARRASEALLGSGASILVSVMILFGILGSLNSVILTAPRITFAMAGDGLFPAILGAVHPRTSTPYWAIAVQALVSCLMVMAGSFYQLLSYTVFFMLLSCIATAAGVFVLRIRRPGLERPYRVWGYPVTTLVFVCSYAWIAVRIFLHDPRNAAIGLLITLTGVPFFLLWNRSRRKAGSVASRTVIPLLVGLLATPGMAGAHGVFHQVTRSEAVLVTAEYDDGDPMSYAEVKIHPPGDGKIAHQTGRTDRNGCFAFVPDVQGQWRVTIDGGMGHVVEAVVTVDEAFHVRREDGDRRNFPKWQGIAVGLGIIFGLCGIIYGQWMRKWGRPSTR